jgi:hypothetical protein
MVMPRRTHKPKRKFTVPRDPGFKKRGHGPIKPFADRMREQLGDMRAAESGQ